jgi:hypothetical protein
VTLIFPDSGSQLGIPAYSGGVYPVFTTGIRFFIEAPAATSADETIVVAMNSVPPPASVSQADFQSSTSANSVSIANGTSVLIAASITGTIRAGTIILAMAGGASGGSCAWSLQSTAGKVLLFGTCQAGASATQVVAVDIPDTFLRFTGLNLVISGLAGTLTGNISPNIFYSVP